jgi:hypothetical protein
MHLTPLVHVAAGVLAIVFGFVALYAAKGARLHRMSGMLFVYAMLTMALLGAALAAVRGVQPSSNVPVGLLTAYLVVTALVTVRPPARGSRWLDLGLFLVALGVSLTLLAFGLETAASASGTRNGVPPFPFFVFGGVALLASVGDVRMIRSGGVQILRGAPRLKRHLWRMCFALALAAFSGLGRFKVIPAQIRLLAVFAIPLIVFASMSYWLWRLRVRRHTSTFNLKEDPCEHSYQPF